MKKMILTRFRVFTTAMVLAATLFATGCATQRQVKEIVSASNMASLSTELGLGGEDPSKPAGVGDSWKDASAKIEAFVAEHPENKTTIAVLRVRQAMMLLNNKQYNLAKAAFAEAKLEDLRASSRDRSLKRLEADLLWWYPTAGGTLPASEFTTASNTLTHISTVWSDLRAPEDEGIRDWLAALRAWIGLKMANDGDADVLGTNTVRRFLEDAINTYATMLPPGEAASWQSVPTFPPVGLTLEIAIAGPNRRRFRADDLIVGAKRTILNNRIAKPVFNEVYFRDRITQ